MPKDCAFDNSWGQHLCSIYRNKEEQLAVAVPYMADGLRNNQRCVYIADEAGRQDICSGLDQAGIDVDSCVGKGQLVVNSIEETYLKGGFFSAIGIIDTIINAHYQALHDGYTGLRGSGDLSRLACDPSLYGRVIDYEREINFLFVRNHLIGLCQYDETVVPEDMLAGVIYTHPKAIIQAKAYENPFYISPDVFNKQLNKKYPQSSYRKLKDGLISRVDKN